MRKKLIVGNWKMNGNKKQAVELVQQLLANLTDLQQQIECVVCPPSVYLDCTHQVIQSSNTKIPLQLGAQNVATNPVTAFTGEISPAMLHEFGCTYVIIGHSERRKLLHESNELIARRVDVALDNSLRPILCLGETQEQQEAGRGFATVADQLQAVLDDVCISEFKNAVIAYEPVWAIGTGLTATPEQAQSMHVHIRKLIAEYDADIADNIRIIYGGSVTSANAVQLLQQPDIDGCLVGGASLKAQEFSEICHTAIGVIR
ncbi:MAG TPA: triose-phosphate isomerase [Gammaproteobacteria bacterium]|nr:triose-phosphate isomerase [Gammaproteobacteria bacterium]